MPNAQIINLTDVVLARGGHDASSCEKCFNEWVCFLAGEPHSDNPSTISPVVRRFTMTLNDRLSDADRQRLVPYLTRTLGTADDGRDEERRRMCAEWLVKESALPGLLDAAGCADAAERLRTMPDDIAWANMRELLDEVRREAWDARSRALAGLRARVKEAVKEKLAAADAATAAHAATATAAADAAADAATAAHAAAADAATATAADPWAPGGVYGRVYRAVYDVLRPKCDAALAPFNEGRLDSALALLDRMLPEQPVRLPAVEVIAA